MIDPGSALPGRDQAMRVVDRHVVLGTPLQPPFPEGVETAIFGMGCFWGAERIFWQASGVYTTAVGYAGGYTPNPTYEEVCSGATGDAEVVLVAFRTRPGAADADAHTAAATSYEEMLRLFWEGHDPTQGMRQGNDAGTQYRSLILFNSQAQREQAEASLRAYQERLSAAGYGEITTEIVPAEGPSGTFYYAEDYHQQYLAKNPGGYCPDHSTGIACPVGLNVSRSLTEARSPSSASQ